jgi:hypothetical protein
VAERPDGTKGAKAGRRTICIDVPSSTLFGTRYIFLGRRCIFFTALTGPQCPVPRIRRLGRFEVYEKLRAMHRIN